MKKMALLAGMMIAATIGAGAAYADGAQDFTMTNSSGYQLRDLHISPADADTWGADVLGVNTLEDGQSVDIKFTGPDDVCKFDIQLTDETGAKYYVRDIDLCKTHKFDLKASADGQDWVYTAE